MTWFLAVPAIHPSRVLCLVFLFEHGLKHSNADALSRLPCKQCGRQDSEAIAAPSEIKKEESNDVTNSVTEAFQAMSSWVPVLPFDQKREQQSDPASDHMHGL